LAVSIIVTPGNRPLDSPGLDRRLSSARWLAGVSVTGDSPENRKPSVCFQDAMRETFTDLNNQ